MTENQKKQLTISIEPYLEQHQLSQSDLATRSGVNAAYIIAIRQGKYTMKVGSKSVPIKDKWLNRLASTVGLQFEKQYWKTIATPQMKSMLSALKDAKDNGEAAVITGETGCGKTYITDLFAQRNPKDVFVVKAGSSDNLADLLNKIIRRLRIGSTTPRSKSGKISAIIRYIQKMNEAGNEPMLIIDEAEYLKLPALCAYKELYDTLNTWCAMVLIGTDQLLVNLDRLKKRNKPGIPQLFRRIKYRIRQLPAIDRRFKDFLTGYEIGLKNWLKNNCDNYGELHDVLTPALREADRTGEKLTEGFVHTILGI